jgi:acetolactate synthase-1/2/3 large subunit
MALTRAHAYAPVPAADGLLHPSEVCAVISALLPENGIVVADTGFSSQWAVNYIALRRSGQRLIKAAGSLGWGFPAALGAKCAAPDAPVICFTGDGGFFYHMSELETARRHGLNVTIVVNNNGCLAQGAANIHLAYQGRAGNRDEIFRYRPTNFAAIATEMGCIGVVARTSDEFSNAFKRALDSDTPFVIDAKTSAIAVPG